MNIRRVTTWSPIVAGLLGIGAVLFIVIAGILFSGIPKDSVDLNEVTLYATVSVLLVGLGNILRRSKERVTVRLALYTLLAVSLVSVLLPNLLHALSGTAQLTINVLIIIYGICVVKDIRQTYV